MSRKKLFISEESQNQDFPKANIFRRHGANFKLLFIFALR